jgi:hypothetical protein
MTVGQACLFTDVWANARKDWGRGFPAEKVRAVEEKNVLKRLATPEVRLELSCEEWLLTSAQDVAEQVRFLALSRSITGMNAVIDAGFSI